VIFVTWASTQKCLQEPIVLCVLFIQLHQKAALLRQRVCATLGIQTKMAEKMVHACHAIKDGINKKLDLGFVLNVNQAHFHLSVVLLLVKHAQSPT
jgi:hypothetical protein